MPDPSSPPLPAINHAGPLFQLFPPPYLGFIHGKEAAMIPRLMARRQLLGTPNHSRWDFGRPANQRTEEPQ